MFKVISKKDMKVEFESRFVFCPMRVDLSVLNICLLLTTLTSQCPPPCWMPRLRRGYDACMWRAPRGKDLTIVGDTRNMEPHGNIEMGWWQYHEKLCVGRPRF